MVRGQFNFDGVYTNQPVLATQRNTGIAQFLLIPTVAHNGGTVDYVGGPGHKIRRATTVCSSQHL